MHLPFPRLLLLAALWLVSGIPTTGAQVRLTEVLPVNRTGYQDQYRLPQPWIEIWNPSKTSGIDLFAYRLVHDGVTWLFPRVQMMPDERLVFFASGLDEKVITAPLHTSFSLSPQGGTVTLQNSSGSTISTLTYPLLAADESWGRDESDTASVPQFTGRYTLPTPGEHNNFIGEGVAGRVIFNTASMAFAEPLTVTLTMERPHPNAVIRYTTNRSVPVATSPLYTGPLTIDSTQMIRARVFHPGLLPGETGTRAWLALHTSTRNFSSPLPIAVLSPFTTTAPPDDGDQLSFLWVWQPGPDGLARFTDLPTLTARTVIDKRGSSTLSNPKFNLNLEAWNDYDDDERGVALLGMAPHSDWVFHAPFEYDRSLFHNPLMYALSRSIGQYAPDGRMAEVFIDITGGQLTFTGTPQSSNDYYGVYNVLEKIRRGKDRVDIEKLEPYDNAPADRTGGYIWKVDRLDPGDSGFTAGGLSQAYYYPKERELETSQRTPQRQYLTSYIDSFQTALQSLTWTDPMSGYAAWLDVPSAIDNHLLHLWSYNVDALRLSTFWHKDAGGKIRAGPVWDFDRALSSTDGRDANPLTWGNGNWPEGGFFAAHWWNRLFHDIDFYQKYIDRWQELRRGTFSPASINALIDSMTAAMGPAPVARDLARWQKAKRGWKSPYTAITYPAGQEAEVQRIKDYLAQRAGYFDTQWVGPVTASPGSGYVPAGSRISLSGPPGIPIYFTLDGRDPRPSGGGTPIAGSLAWEGQPIAVTPGMQLTARAWNPSHTALSGGTINPPLISRWGGIIRHQYSSDPPASPGTVAITEIHFNPPDPTSAEAAQDPTWTHQSFEFLELQNTGPHRIQLGGARFTDGVTFEFTEGERTVLEPGAHLVVSSHPAAFLFRYGKPPAAVLGPWTGNLSNSGETLTLTTATGEILQTISYGDQWYPPADKGGFSLVIYDPMAPPGSISQSGNWRASALPGGSPGQRDPSSTSLPGSGNVLDCNYVRETHSLILEWKAVAGTAYDLWISADLKTWALAATAIAVDSTTGSYTFKIPDNLPKLFLQVLPSSSP